MHRLVFACDGEIMLVSCLVECLRCPVLLLDGLIMHPLRLLFYLLLPCQYIFGRSMVLPVVGLVDTYRLCRALLLFGRLECFADLCDMFLGSDGVLFDRLLDLLCFA
jgi:hypothetical protein